jgi:hypothetical protein
MAEFLESLSHVTRVHGDKECVGVVNLTRRFDVFRVRVEPQAKAVDIGNDHTKAQMPVKKFVKIDLTSFIYLYRFLDWLIHLPDE